LSNDKKKTTFKVPLLHKIPYLGEKVFTSRGVIERKTDLVIQITPKIIEDAYTGIVKSKEVAEYEKYVIGGQSPQDKKELDLGDGLDDQAQELEQTEERGE
jgi:type II secretory pathway component GspD/PulD (secretin)